MSLNTSPIIDDNNEIASPEIGADVTPNIFMGNKPALKNWKMFSKPPNDDFLAEQEQIQHRNFSDRMIPATRVAPVWLQIGQALAVFVTVAWISYATIYILALPNSIKTITSSPLTLGGILASVLAPIAMMWLCIATWQRRSDAHIYAEALRDELRSLFYPNADQSNLIGDDIRGLMKQATEMSASSRGAIKAIQRARTGLRAEIRDFAGVSQKAEFHIDRLADALSKRAEELLSLTETIEAQTEVISAKAKQGVGQWENIASEITELGDEIDHIFDRGSQKIQIASDTATQKIQSMEVILATAVENLSSRIGNVSSQIDVTRSNLDDQANRLENVSTAINLGSERLETSLTDAENVYGAVEGMMNIMSNSLNKVDDTAEQFFVKSDAIEKKLLERTDGLKETADRLLSSTEGLQNIGDITTHKLGEALSMAISGAETITSAVRRSKDMIDMAVTDASEQIIQSSKLADKKIEGFIADAQINQEKLSSLISEIDMKHSQIIQSTQNIDESRIQISDAVDKATNQLVAITTDMVQKTEEPLKLILSSIDMLDVHSQTMDDKLSIRVVEVQQETSKIKSLIDGIDTVMKDSLAHMTLTSTHLSDQSNKITLGVDNQKDVLSAFMTEVEEKVNLISSQLDEKMGGLQSAIFTTQDRISGLGQNFFQNSEILVERASTISNKMAGFESSLNGSILSVNSKYSEVADKVSGQIKYMTQLSEYITPEADKILSKVEGIHARYDDLKDKCFTVTDNALIHFESLGNKIQSQVSNLGEETSKSSQAMLTAGNEISLTLTNIKMVAEEAQERIDQIQSGLKGRVDDLHLISDHVQMKVESMQNNLGSYAKDLSDVLQLTMSDLDVATEKFGQTSNLLNDKTDTVTSRIIEATEKYIEEGHRMSMVGEQTAHKSARILNVLKDETEKLVSTASASILDLQKSGDTLSIRTKEIEEYLKASAHHTRTYGNELRDQANMIANHSSDVVEKISKATLDLTIRAKDVIEAGQTVFASIEEAGERLEAETDILGRVAKITIQAVDDAVNGFGQHGETLRRTVSDLSTQVQDICNAKADTEKDTFLNAAKFVIESLYSLAVDVSRHLEGELDIRVMRTYQKGDMAAYIRHLVDTAPKIPVEKSQRKFIEDGEFRTYVLRFIRQYEELLIQAQANDYSDLLSSVFSTSDIGRLYKILCEISGRSAKEH